MFAVLYLPIWRIELTAPQYPEGLALQIFASRIGGQVDIVNGLNHYIGMRTLHTKDFVEFVVLPFIIGGFAVLGLLVGLVNRRWAFYGWAFVFLLIAFTSMIDFYRWEYNYGHNLDSEAPIQVPGMSYQPPLIGYKKLLNFTAYSIPDTGGWIFVGVGVIIFGLAILEGRRHLPRKQVKNPIAGTAILGLLAAILILPGCSRGPQPIAYGQDICAFCKMTFMDKRYGGEVVTKKGKLYKFDDIHCLLESVKAGVPPKEEVAEIYLVDYNEGPMINAADGFLLRSDSLHTPMGGNVAAFAAAGARDSHQKELNGWQLLWKDIYQ
jgi:copper chaperone NosL